MLYPDAPADLFHLRVTDVAPIWVFELNLVLTGVVLPDLYSEYEL